MSTRSHKDRHLEKFTADTKLATVAELEKARDYWQRRADAGSAYQYGQQYADACRAELERRGVMK